VDLYYLMARSSWVESTTELDRLLPPPTDFWRRVAQWVADAM
jgi:hypothetical protein